MSLIKVLKEKPPRLTVASKYTALNGIGYLMVGAILIVWPGVTQTLFRAPPSPGMSKRTALGHKQTLVTSPNRGRL